MGLSTKDVKTTGGSGMPKTIQPGNAKIKVNRIYLETFPFEENAYHLVLDCETSKLDNFEGFFIDKNKESLGRYAGQVGRVKASEWAYVDKVLANGNKINRDLEILKFVKLFCETTGCDDWFQKVDNKYDTIEEFIKAFDTKKPFEDVYFEACIGGREYENKAGYINYDLSFPKTNRDGLSMTAEDDTSKLLTFNDKTHIKRKKAPEAVESFEAENTDFEIELD